MKNIFINEDKNTLIIENDILKFKDYSFINEYKNNFDLLSGVLLIVDNKILLVKPLKFKDLKNKWSIPKGKIEVGHDDERTALKELEEETGVVLKNIHSEKNIFYYKKGNNLKKLTVFVIEMSKDDLNLTVEKDDTINPIFYDNTEIHKVKFFDIDRVESKIEIEQLPILKLLKNYKLNVEYEY